MDLLDAWLSSGGPLIPGVDVSEGREYAALLHHLAGYIWLGISPSFNLPWQLTLDSIKSFRLLFNTHPPSPAQEISSMENGVHVTLKCFNFINIYFTPLVGLIPVNRVAETAVHIRMVTRWIRIPRTVLGGYGSVFIPLCSFLWFRTYHAASASASPDH